MMGYYQIASGSGMAFNLSSSSSSSSSYSWSAMARSWCVNSEKPPAVDHPSPVVGGGSHSSRRRDLVFVVNPRGANGRTGKEWKKLLPYLRSRLGSDCNICESLTSGPCHAIDITREAIREGADAVIAVGGDGTLHEVLNGFFWAGKAVSNHDKEATHSTALADSLGHGLRFCQNAKLTRANEARYLDVQAKIWRQGQDGHLKSIVTLFNVGRVPAVLSNSRAVDNELFAIKYPGNSSHWKNDPVEAIERIHRGLRSSIDVGVINGEEGDYHYFINVADIHLSAKAGYYASGYKKFGKLCYVIGSLRAFIGHQNQDLKIKVNDGEWKMYPQVTALCIGNAKYFGGGMKITPNAHPSSGNLEVVILQDFKWYDFVLKLHRLYNGTHLSVKNVSSMSVHSIEVEGVLGVSGNIFIQSDGEHLGFLPRKICIVPGAIEMIC